MTRTYINYINSVILLHHSHFNPNLYRSIMPSGCYDTNDEVKDIWKTNDLIG